MTETPAQQPWSDFEDVLQPALGLIEDTASRDGDDGGVATGLHDLDALTNGLHPGQLVGVCGRDGIGKTALATTLASNVATRPTPARLVTARGYRPVFVSLSAL